MTARLQQAIATNAPAGEVARVAARAASETAQTDTEREALARDLYKEATGRFPQDSSDRRAVYLAGFVLVGISFVAVLLLAAFGMNQGNEVPEWISVLATALVSGVIGGLFGYARQQ